MSANNAKTVLVTKPKATGGLYHTLDLTAEIPVDASTPLDSKFIPLGYIGPDGVTRTIDKEIHEVLAAGGVTVKKVPKSNSVDYELTLMQSDLDALTAAFGPENATQDAKGVIRIRHNAKEMPVGAWVFELADGENSIREVVARAQVTNVSDVTLGTGEETLYTITVSGLDDENGDKANTYIEYGDGPEAITE